MNVFNQQIVTQCVKRHASSDTAMNRLLAKLKVCQSRNHVELFQPFNITIMNTITTKQDYDVAMQRTEALIDKATSVGGFANLSQEEVDEFGVLADVASHYENDVLRLYPFRSTSNFATPTRKKTSNVMLEYA
ncbi:hypothetical protein FACS189452_03500 [Bacteroidia bacterium]|nr:hypothetical protein FACS189452_03500 [Bacteroidia bacterium]GHT80978.1 hypothetical protein FACS189467_4250 [Bacteroidia bacterium]